MISIDSTPLAIRRRGKYHKLCIICGKFFIVSSRSSSGKIAANIRKRNCMTCSKDCAKVYNKRMSFNRHTDVNIKKSKGGVK